MILANQPALSSHSFDSINSDTEGFVMNRTKILAVCLGLFTVMMTGLGADLESRAIKSVLKSYSHGASYGQLGTPALDDKIDIIRDQFRMFLIFGGAFGGAVVCVLLRLALTDPAKLKLTRTSWVRISLSPCSRRSSVLRSCSNTITPAKPKNALPGRFSWLLLSGDCGRSFSLSSHDSSKRR